MTCQSLRDVRYSVLELFSKMYHWKLHDSLVGSDHVGSPLRKTNMARGRSLFWLSRNFSSLLNCPYSYFSLHTGCSDVKNTRWIDVFMYVICFSAVAASISLCHGLWKKIWNSNCFIFQTKCATEQERMLLKRGMGNGEWGMGNWNGKLEMGNWIFFALTFYNVE